MKRDFIDEANGNLINNKLLELEQYLDSDILVYYGEIINGVEQRIKDICEDLNNDQDKRQKLTVILTTPGGSLAPVERMVNIFRHFYNEVNYIIPNYAYRAGTILCMSGDNIYMNYYSVLGPIDPQVQNKDGNFVAALGYLDKVNEMIEKAKKNELTDAEFVILKDFDLAELREYEQNKELAINLLEKWLVQYKFKDWQKHRNGIVVTEEDKKERARNIAKELSDNNRWKTHGRPIDKDELESIQLKINDFEQDKVLSKLIGEYDCIMNEYVTKYGIKLFTHTRRFL